MCLVRVVVTQSEFSRHPSFSSKKQSSMVFFLGKCIFHSDKKGRIWQKNVWIMQYSYTKRQHYREKTSDSYSLCIKACWMFFFSLPPKVSDTVSRTLAALLLSCAFSTSDSDLRVLCPLLWHWGMVDRRLLRLLPLRTDWLRSGSTDEDTCTMVLLVFVNAEVTEPMAAVLTL